MDNGNLSYQKFLNGDNIGLVEIIELYSDSLVLFIKGFVHDYNIAEDLMQDTYLELILKKNIFRGESQFKTYLFKIARNKAVDYLRRNRKTVLSENDYVFDDNYFVDVEEDFASKEKQKILFEAINSLNADYYQVIYLSFFEEMSNEEIAAVMKKSKRQVEMLLYRAKKALKTILEKGDELCE